MNPILFRNTSILPLEESYYKSFSSDRYINVENSNNFTILTPFSKEYINKDYKMDGRILEYSQVVNEVIEHTLKIKRFDILSYYHDHNNSPSVRSLHSAKLLFIAEGNFYYYSLYDDQLLQVSDSEIVDESIFKRDKLYILGISDVLNLTRFYNEFSLYATLLDAGHLLYNVKNVLVNKNIDFYQFKNINSKYLYDYIKIDSRYSYISFALEINSEAIYNLTSGFKYHIVSGSDIRLSAAHNELKPTKYLKEILKQYNSSICMNKDHIKTEGIPFLQLSSKLIRNSAHTTIGNNNYGEKFESFEMGDILNYLKKSRRLFSSSGMEYCFLIKTDKGEFIYWPDFTTIRTEIDFRMVMYNDHKFFDFNSYKIVFVCFSKRNVMVENDFKNHLISAAEMMQLVALYSASSGYAFRPMKNHNDRYLKEVLLLNEQYEINFMGVVCNSPIQQLSYFIK